MSVSLSNPVWEQALARMVVEVAAMTDNASALLFKTVARGFPLKQAHDSAELPAAYINPVDFRPETGEFEESVAERDLFGVLVIAEGVGDTDRDRMTDLSTTIMRLDGRLRTGTPTGLESSTLNGWCPSTIHWHRTYTPMIAQNLPINSVMTVFKGTLCHPRTNPLIT